MNVPFGRAIILTAALAAACATPASRIKKNQAAFDAYPPAAQAKIRAGAADVGFTPEQVRMALGKPWRVYTRKTAAAEQTIWAYAGDAGSVGVGFGMATGGMTSYGMGLGVGADTYGTPDEKVRVVFQDGKVVDVQTRVKE